jgi:hypothetical protein
MAFSEVLSLHPEFFVDDDARIVSLGCFAQSNEEVEPAWLNMA